jgi:hypothetical protein
MAKVHSVHAEAELKDKIESVKQSLEMISTELQKYESLQMVHYGHVGDLGHVDELLVEAWEFISETG